MIAENYTGKRDQDCDRIHPYVRSATVGFWLKVGSQNEAERQLGISHMIEHMMFKGTAARSAREIAEAIDATGGRSMPTLKRNIPAITGWSLTCYFGLLVEILADMLLNSYSGAMRWKRKKE